MKITEAWENKDKVIDNCRKHNACDSEFTKLINAKTQIDFENVLLRNFDWCVYKNIFEEWLPESLPDCIQLDCYDCNNLIQLPKLSKCKILNCSNCTKLTSLPKLSKCEILDCSYCDNLKNII